MNSDNEPFAVMAYSVIQQAVEDLQELRLKGFIIDNEPVAPWPTTISKVGHPVPVRCCGYSRPHEVEELLMWLQGDGLSDYLDTLGSTIAASAIRRELFGENKER